ncbi:MAG: hypothetical protein ACJAW3_001175 [Lentimonas sp.]|jgi:hypothetical protein
MIDSDQFEEMTKKVGIIENQVETMMGALGNHIQDLGMSTRIANLSQEELTRLNLKIGELEESFNFLQENSGSDEKLDIDPAKIKDVMALVQDSKELFEHQTAKSLKEVAALNIAKKKNQTEVENATEDNKEAQEYYLGVIRLLGGLHLASLSINSDWVGSNQSGKTGRVGSLLKLAGRLSPTLGGVVVTAGDILETIGSKIRTEEIKKLAKICPFSNEMDEIAQKVALSLLQLNRSDLIKNGKVTSKGNDADKDVSRMLSAVIAGKITSEHDLVAAFVQAALGVEIYAPLKKKIVVSSYTAPDKEITDKHVEILNKDKYDPIRLKSEDVERGNKAEIRISKIAAFILDGESSSEKRKLSNNLIGALIEQVQFSKESGFGEYLLKITTKNDKSEMLIDDMEDILQDSLCANQIIAGGKIDPALSKNSLALRKVAEEFTEKLLERKAEKSPKTDLRRVSSIDKLKQPQQSKS